MEDLTKLQKEFIAGGKLGCDANGAYFHFKAELATSKDIPSLTLQQYIQTFLKKVEAFTTEPELLDDDETIQRFPSIDDSIFYNAVMNIRHHDKMDILFSH